MFLSMLLACGDIVDPDLVTAEVQLDDQVIESIDISTTGTNFFAETVDPASVLVLNYDEPLDVGTVEAHVSLADETGALVDSSIQVKLTDVVVTPAEDMLEGNHALTAEAGIDDASGNTTEATFVISFYVE